MRIYCIGDIHGHLDKLTRAHDLIEGDRAREGDDGAPVIHVGDLVDRGPDSLGVIDRLIGGITRGENWEVLLGNHDRMFLNFVNHARTGDSGLRAGLTWLHPRLGGMTTLASYGIGQRMLEGSRRLAARTAEAVPETHVDFLQSRPLYREEGELLFVHAGIRPGVPLNEQLEDDLLWIRGGFLEVDEPHDWLVVHGHTALEEVTHFGNRIDVDGGAAYGRALDPVVFEGRDAFILGDDGRRRLEPPG